MVLGTNDTKRLCVTVDSGSEAKMSSKGGLIGIVVVVLAVFLCGVVIRRHAQPSDAAQAESAEKARNAELQNKIASPELEVTTPKETADYYFQNGVDMQAAGKLQDARSEFEAVVDLFPTSNLVGSARQRLKAVNEAIAKAEANNRAAEQERGASRINRPSVARHLSR
jgi:TolA-binding protein